MKLKSYSPLSFHIDLSNKSIRTSIIIIAIKKMYANIVSIISIPIYLILCSQ
jgi:hypothetical protein